MGKDEFMREMIAGFKDAGLLVVHKDVFNAHMEMNAHIQKLLKKKTLTPYQIVQNHLLPGVKSQRTIKNMTEDGRIGKNEFFIDANGRWHVLTTALKRLRDE